MNKSLAAALVTLVLTPAVAEAQIVRTAAGTAASVSPTLVQFRADLGPRREINWDGVPDSFAAPNNLPANFFNSNSPRGVVFSTPGTGLSVSANSNNPTGTAVEFGNINASYPALFAPFSAQRLFTAVDSNIVDVNFFVAGTATPALSTGFGAIFADVDLPNTTSISFFGISNDLIGTFFAAPSGSNELMSFLGVSFATPVISRVRITSGNAALAGGVNETAQTDLVVMDDFIYGEPIAVGLVPEPATWVMMIGGMGIVGSGLRRRAKKVSHVLV